MQHYYKFRVGQKIAATLTMCSVIVLTTACGGGGGSKSSSSGGGDGVSLAGFMDASESPEIAVEAAEEKAFDDLQSQTASEPKAVVGDSSALGDKSASSDKEVVSTAGETVTKRHSLSDVLQSDVLSDSDPSGLAQQVLQGGVIPSDADEKALVLALGKAVDQIATEGETSVEGGEANDSGDVDAASENKEEASADESEAENNINEQPVDSSSDDLKPVSEELPKDELETENPEYMAFDQQYDLKDVNKDQELEVFAPLGDLQLNSADSETLNVSIQLLAKDGIQADEIKSVFAEAFPFEWVGDGQLQLKAKADIKRLLEYLKPEDGEALLKITLTVPQAMKVALYRHSGNLEVDQFKGDLRVEQSTGPVTLMGSEGKFALSAASSPLAVVDHQGDMSISAVSGEVDLAGVKGNVWVDTEQKASVNASDINGELHINCDKGDITLARTKGDLSLVSGEGDVSIAEHQGDMALISDAGGKFEYDEPAVSESKTEASQPEPKPAESIEATFDMLAPAFDEKALMMGLSDLSVALDETLVPSKIDSAMASSVKNQTGVAFSSDKPVMPLLPLQEK